MNGTIDTKGLLIFAGVIISAFFVMNGISSRYIIVGLALLIAYLYYRKTWASPRAAIESFTGLISDLTAISSTETDAMRAVHSKLPPAAKLEALRSQYTRVLTPYLENMETQECAVGMLDKVGRYFELMYSNIGLILGDEYYPQSSMVYLLDNQRKLLAQIDDFIFITNGSSSLPESLTLLRTNAETIFREVNLALANYVNTKDENEMNNITGFLPYPDDPEPYNSFN